jgi:hypothetical protein
MIRRVLGTLVVFGVFSPSAFGAPQAPPLTTTAPRTATVTITLEPIDVDGALNEPVWRTASKIGDLTQRQPDEGEQPTERTDVMLVRDERNLYIGVIAYDSEPKRVIGSQMARDASLMADDRIEILLDTFRDQRSAFYFATNPAGALVDGLAFSNGQLNTEWDAIWEVKTRRTDEGWVAEFAIPFKSLSFPAGQEAWGFNIARMVYRKLEDDRWSGARLQTQFLQVSEAGEINSLAGLSQGVGLDLRPFLAGSWLRLGRDQGDSYKRKPGLDLFYHVTPSLKLTATFNTDFAETEVDARQINLTALLAVVPGKARVLSRRRRCLQLCEHRPGGARRAFPATGADLFPFFSRQIGLVSGTGSADRCRRQDDGAPSDAPTSACWTCGRAIWSPRRPADRRGEEFFRRPHQAQHSCNVIVGAILLR